MGRLDRINKFLNFTGYGIFNTKSQSWKKTYTEKYLSLLDVDIVIDVGVANGTPILYNSFPSAYLVLVDPVPLSEKVKNELLNGRNWEFHNYALGSEEGEINMYVDHTQLSKSSVYKRSSLTHQSSHKLVREKVKVMRLDRLVKQFKINLSGKRVFLKVDTEGFEKEVFHGASEILSEVDFILMETSFSKRFEVNYDTIGLLHYLGGFGFSISAVADYTMDNLTGKCIHADLLLERKNVK